MGFQYKSAFITYAFLLIGILLFILMWSLGIEENATISNPLLLLIITAPLTIVSLLIFPFLPNANKILIKTVDGINLAFLLIGLLILPSFVWSLDNSLFTISFLLLFLISSLILIINIGKQLILKPTNLP